eukprot:m.222788 g.222788  ORF g.222788 m.222788 type:complete len:226 (-) comp16102_c0_seq1:151-828(-)
MAPKRDLAAAKLRRQGLDPVIEGILADQEHAQKLALLSAKAGARGAAPAPPGKGGPVAAAPAPTGPPPAVVKMRAIESYNGEVSFEKGATVFVVGEPDASGMYQGVASGKAGKVPKTHLREITEELLREEREAKQKEAEAARAKEEARLKKELEEEERKIDAQLAGKGSSASAGPVTSAEVSALKKEAEAKFQADRQKLLEEEQRLKDEAARLEELMRQLDADDD